MCKVEYVNQVGSCEEKKGNVLVCVCVVQGNLLVPISLLSRVR